MPSAVATSPDGSVIPVNVGGMVTDLGSEIGGSEKGARDERAPAFETSRFQLVL
jgi:hypothetical protein